MDKRKQSVLITGAGSGIGRELSVLLARQGWSVFATDLDDSAAKETARKVCDAGGEGVALALDVTRAGDITNPEFVHACQETHVLINNAGLQHVSPLEEFGQEKWDLLIAVMLSGACRMTRSVLPAMRKRGFGRIINIGSIHSLVASPFKTAYVAAKHGLLGFAKVVALETADADITINTICPSYVRTPLVERQIDAQAKAHGISRERVIDEIMLKPMPKGQFISMEELAGIVTFLASDAARNITGQTITVDGGWTIQ